ncbi:uncharacterized protein [Physcomitrium patens]|uniref:Protein XRI1 n=1 Tax=Physcomitrium patens TaxID=3218 RepID=A0A2K1IFX1_PHYPA|nr:uncharacterized protein LOC112276506 [Physcomitrium patens]PNR28164.1 hypothetical protein PHYPA_028756 [Physcomitrium patens]|eukprot:XP_024363662.1 uncharacterized protein LOC112276506 [Physcomitrella patens]
MLTRPEFLISTSVRAPSRSEMLSDVAVMFAPRTETMALKTKMEPWSHYDDHSYLSELGSPLAISTSFWDQLLHAKGDYNTLFTMTTPAVDRSFQPSTPTFNLYTHDMSQGSDSTVSSSYSDQQGDRCKRRRMLQFNGVNTCGFGQDSPPPYESVTGSPTTTYSSYSSSYSYSPSSYESSPLSSVKSGDDYLLQHYESPGLPPSSWFSGSDGISSCMVPNQPQQPLDNWSLLNSFEKNQSYGSPLQTKATALPVNTYISNPLGELCAPQTWKRPLPPTPQPNFSQQHTQPQMHYQQTLQQVVQPKQEAVVSQCTFSPFSKPPTPGRKSCSGPSRFKTKSPKPVALPFTMLKPSAAHGDVTLNDINRILLSSPAASTDRLSPSEERRPCTPPGAGLSGKFVVACTKIHTEGAGTITIMRTKG